jgi:diaminohydroxyphosphoribosylaminopyrimidine deaminase/5-amino-6-(5-phosphoribosylamino)uracil reductase
MAQALDLARIPPFTSPNPRVGAIVVRDGSVIASAFHAGAGNPHAEAVAISSTDVTEATCYVTLEPCNHHGRMPPCAPALVEAGIAEVVVAVTDPDRRVDGAGIAFLRGRGVRVTTGVLEKDASVLNAAYLHERRTGRPLVTAKVALTLDGHLAASDGSSMWITSDASRRRVHARRLEADAVMVGSGTVLVDDPSLTVRAVPASRQPARIVVDSRGRVPASARVFGRGAEVLVATTDHCSHDVQTAWKQAGAEVLVLPERDGHVDLDELVAAVADRGWLEIACEGGGHLTAGLLRAGVVGRLELYYGPVVVGGGPDIGSFGITSLAEAPRFRLVELESLEDDIRAVYMPRDD